MSLPPLPVALPLLMAAILTAVGRFVPRRVVDALALLKRPSFAAFVVCMFLICIPLYFYFVNMAIYLGELEWTSIGVARNPACPVCGASHPA